MPVFQWFSARRDAAIQQKKEVDAEKERDADHKAIADRYDDPANH